MHFQNASNGVVDVGSDFHVLQILNFIFSVFATTGPYRQSQHVFVSDGAIAPGKLISLLILIDEIVFGGLQFQCLDRANRLLRHSGPIHGCSDQAMGVHEPESEPDVEPVSGRVHLPAGVVEDRRYFRRPNYQVLHVSPSQLWAK